MRIIIVLFLVFIFFSEMQAQPNIPPDPPSAVPIAGLGYLLLAGGLLGINKVRKAIRGKS